MSITLWDIKEPTHQTQRVGHGVPGVLVWSGLWGGGRGRAPRMGPIESHLCRSPLGRSVSSKSDKSNQQTLYGRPIVTTELKLKIIHIMCTFFFTLPSYRAIDANIGSTSNSSLKLKRKIQKPVNLHFVIIITKTFFF